MQTKDLLRQLDRWDSRGIWAFTLPTLRLLFPESEQALLKGIGRQEKLGLIRRICRGIYVNPRARSLPPDILPALIDIIRPWDFNYMSLESVLSEAGRISQMPGRLTVMSTGRSQVFETPYGVIEFVHTKRTPEKTPGVTYDTSRHVYVASPETALRDLRRVGRNLDLMVSDNE